VADGAIARGGDACGRSTVLANRVRLAGAASSTRTLEVAVIRAPASVTANGAIQRPRTDLRVIEEAEADAVPAGRGAARARHGRAAFGVGGADLVLALLAAVERVDVADLAAAALRALAPGRIVAGAVAGAFDAGVVVADLAVGGGVVRPAIRVGVTAFEAAVAHAARAVQRGELPGVLGGALDLVLAVRVLRALHALAHRRRGALRIAVLLVGEPRAARFQPARRVSRAAALRVELAAGHAAVGGRIAGGGVVRVLHRGREDVSAVRAGGVVRRQAGHAGLGGEIALGRSPAAEADAGIGLRGAPALHAVLGVVAGGRARGGAVGVGVALDALAGIGGGVALLAAPQVAVVVGLASDSAGVVVAEVAGTTVDAVVARDAHARLRRAPRRILLARAVLVEGALGAALQARIAHQPGLALFVERAGLAAAAAGIAGKIARTGDYVGAGRALRGDAVAVLAASLVGLAAAAGERLAGAVDAPFALLAVEVVDAGGLAAGRAVSASKEADCGQEGRRAPGDVHTVAE